MVRGHLFVNIRDCLRDRVRSVFRHLRTRPHRSSLTTGDASKTPYSVSLTRLPSMLSLAMWGV